MTLNSNSDAGESSNTVPPVQAIGEKTPTSKARVKRSITHVGVPNVAQAEKTRQASQKVQKTIIVKKESTK